MSSPATILIVDDEERNRALLNDYVITLGHTPVLADNGLSALARIKNEPPDLMLLDIMMPEMDGHAVLARMRTEPAWQKVPVIVISAVDDMDSVVKCIQNGAEDYLVKPFQPSLLRARIEVSLERKRLRDQAEDYERKIEDYSLRLEDRVREEVRKVSEGQLSTIFAMSKLAESRDPETGAHLERMREYCRILARQLRRLPKFDQRIDEDFIDNLYIASPLHDIGKVATPDRILLKPGKLTDEEFEIMKSHASIGAATLREVNEKHPGNGFLILASEIAECHHEKWNGTGYPRGLVGEDIPLSARIVALADVYDALTSERCYKNAFTHEKSKGIIVGERGNHFDPDIVDAFVEAHETFDEVRKRHQNMPAEAHLEACGAGAESPQ